MRGSLNPNNGGTQYNTHITNADELHILRQYIAQEAGYNAFINDSTIQRSSCTPKTRVNILENLIKWARDPHGPRVYWMNGMAGTGKTTIAYSFCQMLALECLLGASFFCSRSLTKCSDVRRIIPTLACHIAQSRQSVAESISKMLRTGDMPGPMRQQFQMLISEPVRVAIPAIEDIQIIVIDALDECIDPSTVSDLIKIIWDYIGEGNLPFKIFITSRPETLDRSPIVSTLPHFRSIFHLHDVEKDMVQADIQLYLKHELRQIGARSYPALASWPSDDEVDALAKKADKLFIHAATAIRYVGEFDADSRARLTAMTEVPTSLLQTEAIDNLYTNILDLAVRRKERKEIENLRLVLGAVVSVQNPLTVVGLATLLGRSPEDIEVGLAPLRSVVSFPSSPNQRISVFHASFPDFLTDAARSGSDRFIDSSWCHQELSVRCIKLLNSALCENPCALDWGQTVSATNLQRAIEEDLYDGVSYACIFWTSHAVATGEPQSLFLDQTSQFLDAKLLFWLEHLSLLSRLDIVISTLPRLALLISVSSSLQISQKSLFNGYSVTK